MSNEGVTVTMKINDGIRDIEIPLEVPPGIDPRQAVLAVQASLNELHELAPLHPMQQKIAVAVGLFGDHVPIGKIRGMLLEAPGDAEWGIQIIEPPKVLANPVYRKQDSPVIKARARLSECRDVNEVIGTLTCYALLTSRSARGYAALHGFQPMIVPPKLPDRPADMEKPAGAVVRKLRLVAPPEAEDPSEPEGGGAA